MNNRLFTPGPVNMNFEVLKIGSCQMPYFRTQEFSNITFEIINGLKKICFTGGEIVILTSSGTGAMECAVINFLTQENKILIINGGIFGQRWVNICNKKKLDVYNYESEPGVSPDYDELRKFISNNNFDTIIATAHETSFGLLYDIKKIGAIAAEYNLFFIVDAVSTILADEYYMDDWNVDVTIFSSQKGLALPPGLSFLALSLKALKKMNNNDSFYFDIKNYLKNLKRGQLPFTPAISIMLMLQKQLQIILNNPVEYYINDCKNKSEYFRSSLKDLPFRLFPDNPSNAVTCINVEGTLTAVGIVEELKSKYNIFVTPNAPPFNKNIFRVSHLGEQTIEDLKYLIEVLQKIVG